MSGNCAEAALSGRLSVSTIADDCRETAEKYGLTLEIADFCWAYHLDNGFDEKLEAARKKADGVGAMWFHAPFAELAPCALDPRARALAALRYRQSIAAAEKLGTRRIVIHGGYIPHVYFPESYVERSIEFWKEFLRDAPEDAVIALENVMEPSPDMLVSIVRGVGDPRLGLCLDLGHANCSVSETPPLDWIAPTAPYLFHVHLHNNAGMDDLHAPIFDGTVPTEEAVRRILALCPAADFTIENMHCEPSVSALREKGFI